MEEQIWYENMKAFVSFDKVNKFFPTNDMTYEEKLNSFLRFSIYFSIAVFLMRKNAKVFFMPVFVGLFTLILYKLYLSETKEPFDEEEEEEAYVGTQKCTKPSELNPFMNVLMDEYATNASRGPACNASRTDIKQDIERHFESDLFKSVDDVFNKNASFRQFYTNPITTIPNDQEAFSKWLYYSEEKTCKEGNTFNCLP